MQTITAKIASSTTAVTRKLELGSVTVDLDAPRKERCLTSLQNTVDTMRITMMLCGIHGWGLHWPMEVRPNGRHISVVLTEYGGSLDVICTFDWLDPATKKKPVYNIEVSLKNLQMQSVIWIQAWPKMVDLSHAQLSEAVQQCPRGVELLVVDFADVREVMYATLAVRRKTGGSLVAVMWTTSCEWWDKNNVIDDYWYKPVKNGRELW